MARLDNDDLTFAADELRLYAENTGEIYEQRASIAEAMRGPYDEGHILERWRAFFTDAKFRYAREIGTPEVPFTHAVIVRAAREMFDDVRDQIVIDRQAAMELAARS